MESREFEVLREGDGLNRDTKYGPPITKPQNCNLLDLRTLRKCSTLRICCSICGANLFIDLQIGNL
jgi:hypothetical protein